MKRPIIALTTLVAPFLAVNIHTFDYDGNTFCGTFGDFVVKQPYLGVGYSCTPKYIFYEAGSVTFSIGWQNSAITSSTTIGSITYPNSWFPIKEKTISGVAGDVISFPITIPARYVGSQNVMILNRYDIIGASRNTITMDMAPQERITEVRDIGDKKILYGNFYSRYDVSGKRSIIFPATRLSNFKESYILESSYVLPLDKLKFEFFNNVSNVSEEERDYDDDFLLLTISGPDFEDFAPYIDHGANYTSDHQGIEFKLLWKDEGNGYFHPIADVGCYNYDLGDGLMPYSESIKLPKSGNEYPTYEVTLSNYDNEIGTYFCKFSVEPSSDYFGSCRNSSWCVEVY